MDFVSIKPLSVNECWRGQRFKTDKYKNYEYSLLFLLPKIILPAPPYEIHFVFGLSNMSNDFDNSVKPFTDVLQKKYGFNDREIMRAVIDKKIVKKGSEYIGFKITHHEENIY